MAENDLLIRYRAEIDELISKLEQTADKFEQISDTEKKAKTTTDQTINAQVAAQKRRIELLKQEEAELKKLQAQQKQWVGSTQVVNEFNKRIDEGKKKVAALKNEIAQFGKQAQKSGKEASQGITSGLSSAGTSAKQIFGQIAGALGLAFSVATVVQFGKAAVDAFLEAEESAQRLAFAVKNIAGEGDATLQRLIDQSNQLQKTTIFSDEQIQGAQTALLTFTQSSEQLDELLPKIIDFASAQRIDLAQATDTVVRALEGQTRGLITAGVAFKDTGSNAGNYVEILKGLSKFTGAATEAAKTYSGQLAIDKNRSDELAESIGKNLTPSYVSLKRAVLEAVDALLRFGKIGDFTPEDFIESARQGAQQQVDALQEQGRSTENIIEVLERLSKVSEDEVTDLRLNIKLRTQARDLSISEFNALDKQARAREAILQVYKAEIEQLKQSEEANKRILNSEALRVLSIEQLTKALEDNQAKTDPISKDNVVNINKEIEARKKQGEQEKKLAEERMQQLAKIRALEAQTSFDLITDDAEKLKAQFAEQIRLLQEQGLLTETIRINLQEKLNNDLAELDAKFLAEETDRQLAAIEDAEKKKADLKERLKKKEVTDAAGITPDIDKLIGGELPEEIVIEPDVDLSKFNAGIDVLRNQLSQTNDEIDNDVKAGVKTFIEGELEKIEASEDFIAKVKALLGELKNESAATTDSMVADWINKNAEILQATSQLVNELSSLFTGLADTRIEQLEREQDANQTALDDELEALEKQKDQRLISQADFEKKSAIIKQKEVDAEKKVADEIKKIKRKQAIANKAAALFEIAINTAIAATAALAVPPPPNVVLQALTIALGAAQAVAVAAQPIPAFKKGTTGTKHSGFALVGEAGPEITYLEKGTKVLSADKTVKYREAIDAMQQGRFTEYLFKFLRGNKVSKAKGGKEEKPGQTIQVIHKKDIQTPAGNITVITERTSPGAISHDNRSWNQITDNEVNNAYSNFSHDITENLIDNLYQQFTEIYNSTLSEVTNSQASSEDNSIRNSNTVSNFSKQISNISNDNRKISNLTSKISQLTHQFSEHNSFQYFNSYITEQFTNRISEIHQAGQIKMPDVSVVLSDHKRKFEENKSATFATHVKESVTNNITGSKKGIDFYDVREALHKTPQKLHPNTIDDLAEAIVSKLPYNDISRK